jgi:putative ABC transport system ATP-binding protein
MIELIGVSKVYGREASTVRALDGVSLQLNPGELTAVMGPSGSGKTTLLNIIGCLDSATSGDYFLDGRDVAKLDLRAKPRCATKCSALSFRLSTSSQTKLSWITL